MSHPPRRDLLLSLSLFLSSVLVPVPTALGGVGRLGAERLSLSLPTYCLCKRAARACSRPGRLGHTRVRFFSTAEHSPNKSFGLQLSGEGRLQHSVCLRGVRQRDHKTISQLHKIPLCMHLSLDLVQLPLSLFLSLGRFGKVVLQLLRPDLTSTLRNHAFFFDQNFSGKHEVGCMQRSISELHAPNQGLPIRPSTETSDAQNNDCIYLQLHWR